MKRGLFTKNNCRLIFKFTVLELLKHRCYVIMLRLNYECLSFLSFNTNMKSDSTIQRLNMIRLPTKHVTVKRDDDDKIRYQHGTREDDTLS